MNETVQTIILNAGFGLAGTGLMYLLFAKKHKAETEGIVVDQFNKLAAAQDKRIDDLDSQVEHGRVEREELKRKVKEAEQANEDCEFEHGITRLQLNKALRKLSMTDWIKATVFVLDDQKVVTDVFAHRFKTIPVVYFKAFTDPLLCLKEAQKERPEILVLDYILGDNRTAEDIIKALGYEPEIFIMSGSKENEARFKGTDIKFFYKDRFFIKNITRAILEYLIHKNQ